MALNEYEFFNGVVLNRLIRKGKPIKIDIFPTSGNNSFMINDKVGLFLKYSAKKISSWRFSFTREHQEEMKIMKDLLSDVYLILICGRDGIACIEYEELKIVLDEYFEDVEWVSASRLKREKYSIKGSNGKLDFKIADSDFPKKIFDKID